MIAAWRKRRVSKVAAALVSAVAAAFPISGKADDAPLGFAWGPVDKIPKPSTVKREANLTTLFYDESSPVSTGVDTARVIVEVCRVEGLQHVIWISRQMSDGDLKRNLEAARAQATTRYGQPKQLPLMQAEVWGESRVLIAVSKGLPGQQRLVMSMQGEQYDKCSAEHEAAAGHSASSHLGNLVLRAY